MNPFGDFIPGINVGNALKQFATGRDYDIIDGISVTGGDRNPAPGAMLGGSVLGIGMTQPSQGSPLSSYNPANGSGGTPNQDSQIQGQQTTYAAQQAAQQAAEQADARRRFAEQRGVIDNTALDSARNAGSNYRSNILDFVDQLRSGQRNVDNQAIGNEMGRQQGVGDIRGMVGRGISSAGTRLANSNSLDSSAADAIARAYGQIGQREMSRVGNQYEMANLGVENAQNDLMTQQQSGVRRLGLSKDNIVNDIVGQARQGLASLDAAMAQASLPDRIAIEQEKEAIKAQVLQELSQYDQMLANDTQVNPMDQNARIAEATRRRNLGQASDQQFNYSSETPAQFAGSGPFAAQLPIFTYRNNREE